MGSGTGRSTLIPNLEDLEFPYRDRGEVEPFHDADHLIKAGAFDDPSGGYSFQGVSDLALPDQYLDVWVVIEVIARPVHEYIRNEDGIISKHGQARADYRMGFSVRGHCRKHLMRVRVLDHSGYWFGNGYHLHSLFFLYGAKTLDDQFQLPVLVIRNGFAIDGDPGGGYGLPAYRIGRFANDHSAYIAVRTGQGILEELMAFHLQCFVDVDAECLLSRVVHPKDVVVRVVYHDYLFLSVEDEVHEFLGIELGLVHGLPPMECNLLRHR